MFGAFIIGDELLVGKREDKHLAFLIGALAKRGLRLAWAHYLGDEPARLTEALKRSFASSEVVFSLPSMGADGSRIHVELGVRGDPAQVGAAMEALRAQVSAAGFPYK